MTTHSTNDKDFDSDISSSKLITIVDFWAEWCGPCKQIGPILEAISDEKSDLVKIIKINIDENPITPQKYGVRGIPTTIIVIDGELKDTKVGMTNQSDLVAWLKSNI